MFNAQFANIELTMSQADFESALRDQIDNWPEHMNYSIKNMASKNGRHIYAVNIDNGNGSSFDIYAEQDSSTGDMHFYPFGLKNANKTFYLSSVDSDISGTDEDPANFACKAIADICSRFKGTVALITPSAEAIVVSNGSMNTDVTLGIVDKNGHVYSKYVAKDMLEDQDDEDGVSGIKVKTPINQWIQAHPDVAIAIQSLPLTDKMNYIGAYLIKSVMSDEIDGEEFRDIFGQAALFGFTDQNLLNTKKMIL